jgi:uncharacterized membrane protein YraQ (UPF0718 family)
MSVQVKSIHHERQDNKKSMYLLTLFLIIAAAGLLYVKWWPYYHKAIIASTSHSIGSSVIMGDASFAPPPSWQAAWDYALSYFKSVWKAALLGIVLGSLVQSLFPTRLLLKLLGKANFGSTAIAGLASIPSMMCTCCAAPIAIGLRKKNVSVGAALAYWLGNPALNPATLIFMTFVLSWKFTVLRLVFGIVLTFGVSYLANRFAGDTKTEDINSLTKVDNNSSQSFLSKWMSSLSMMTIRVIPAYIISVLLLGAFRAWLFPSIGEVGANSVIAILGFAIVGMLFVIPTAAEIPIIQAFISLGMGMGPVAALLITLPSVSLPSLIMVHRSFPKRVIWLIIFSVVILGVLSGLAGMLFL